MFSVSVGILEENLNSSTILKLRNVKTNLRNLYLLFSNSEFSILTGKKKQMNIAKPHCLLLFLNGTVIALFFVNLVD